MKSKALKKLYSVTFYFEIFIGILIVIALGASVINLLLNLKFLVLNPTNNNGFQDFLGIAFNLIIGLEFLKMLCKSNLSTVVEVLLFAIARQLIVEHPTIYENLVGVITIAILFVVRKFLFIPQLDDEKE